MRAMNATAGDLLCSLGPGEMANVLEKVEVKTFKAGKQYSVLRLMPLIIAR
eukprot:SAG31_NODE_4346_length_3329_cov_1.499690_2_plen_51_part_00